MACIDRDGNLTRTAEIILLATINPSDIDSVIQECGIAPFRIRSGLRELEKGGLVKYRDKQYQITSLGIKKLEGKKR